MPEAQDEDGRVRNLVAKFVVADDDAANLARLIGFEFLAYSGMIDQSIGRVHELL